MGETGGPSDTKPRHRSRGGNNPSRHLNRDLEVLTLRNLTPPISK